MAAGRLCTAAAVQRALGRTWPAVPAVVRRTAGTPVALRVRAPKGSAAALLVRARATRSVARVPQARASLVTWVLLVRALGSAVLLAWRAVAALVSGVGSAVLPVVARVLAVPRAALALVAVQESELVAAMPPRMPALVPAAPTLLAVVARWAAP